MTGFLRGLLLGNWRNKGVALFFAVTIWFVAYQSEKQTFSTPLRVTLELAPADQDTTIITGMKKVDPQSGAHADFDGSVRVTFSGPRKQIDKIRDNHPAAFFLDVPRDREVFTFRQEDFGFPRDGVDIMQFTPEAVRISMEESATVKVENLGEKLAVSNFKEGYEVASKQVLLNHVQITGPKSLIGGIGVSMNVSMDYVRERFRGKVDIIPTFPGEVPADLVKRAVRLRPTEAEVDVALQASTDVLPAEAVRITFRLPPVKIPVKIVLDDIVGDTVPVEFYGRKDEIARLRDRIRDQPGFSLGVRVPSFDRELGGQFTFTEDSLELYGFPGVQIRQHETRRQKTAWSYTVVPVKEAEK